MDRLNLTVNIKPGRIGKKNVNVRSSMTVANFIAAIQDKYSLDGTLELTTKGVDGPLELAEAFERLGIEEGANLTCSRIMEDTGTRDAIQRGVREEFGDQFKRVHLVESTTLTEYDLDWQPAIVGRKDHRNPSNNRLLAVDLEGIEDLPTVSRHHACITMSDGSFFIEQIQDHNPTYVDETVLEIGVKHPLPAGAEIRLGRLILKFNVRS
jgi:hypothetical protein